MKNTDYHCARKFGNIYRFIDDRIAVNYNKEFQGFFKEIYPAELELKKEDVNHNVATFLNQNITIKQGQFATKLYDKKMDLISPQ